MPEQIVRTSASPGPGFRAASVRKTPCLGAMVQYAVQYRSPLLHCRPSSEPVARLGRRRRLCHADRVFRMLELLGGLSLVTDLGSGSPLEESLKRCLVATRLARISGCTEPEVSDVLYTALLQHLGCTAYAHEMARVWGDDIVTARVSFLSDSGELADMWRVWIPGVAKATGRSKARVLATTVVTARRMEEGHSGDVRSGPRGFARARAPRAGPGGPVPHVRDVERQGPPKHCR